MIKIGLTDFTPADKTIEIRDKKEVIKAKYAISATDILKCTLMNEHYIEISFQYNRYIAFKRSDYILWNGSKYTLREDYIPEQVNKRKYDYTLRFEAVEMLFQDIQYYYLNQSLKESEWRLAGNPEYFIKIAVDNANRYFKVTDFQIGVIEPTEVKDIIFDTNTNTFDALTQIAEAYESEWYMTGKTINLVKKVSFGAEVDFETEVSILSMSRSEGENSKKYTRILALGSERNLPKDYRGSSTGEGVDAVYPKRLRIPAAKGDVIDAYPNMSPDEVVEGTVIFDEVYPKRVGTIQAVGTIEYTDTDEDTGEVTKWNAFKIKDSGINFKEEYLLPGVELRLSMQSGDLNGFDFALKFHKDGFSSSDNSQYFEIVRSEDYGKKLPNDTMKPKAGDKYVLYGFNIALVSDQYVPAGELELFDTASAWLQKQLQDTSVYDCPTVIDHFKKNEMDLELGQNVRLIKDLGGGRNLKPNSKTLTGLFATPNVNATANAEWMRFAMADFTGEILQNVNVAVQPSTEYTQSVLFRTDANNIDFSFTWWNVESSNREVKATIEKMGANTYRAYSTFKTSSKDARIRCLDIRNIAKSGGTYIEFAYHKFELGNKPTDWSAAPEDIGGTIRSSRIMGFEKKLVNKYDATYTVGDNSAYSRLAAIEKDLKELQYAGVIYENTGSGGVYLIKQFDTTPPSDFNAYSAKASDAKYFNKKTGGGIQGDTLFQKNMQVQGSAISDIFQNSTFTAGQLGSGFQIKRDANGQSYMEVDNLMVRRETVFNKLTIAEIKSVGGSILLSLANMVVSKVEDKISAWRCYFDNLDGTVPNDFAVNDQVICRKFTGKNIKYYWSKVTSVGINFIEISKTDKDGSGVPAVADEVIQLGNRTDVNRQYAIMLSAYGSDAPSIKQYAGINSYDLTDKEVTAISPKGNKFTGSFTVSTNGTTAPVYKERQVFVNGTVYYLNDRVSYLGSYWVCIVNSTITTPSETSTTWRKDTTGQTDINNAVENIQIGGRNLKPNSKTLTGLFQAPGTYATANAEWMRFPMSNFSGEIVQYAYAPVQPNTEYCQSVLFRTDATDVNFNFSWWNNTNNHREVKATIEKMGANTYRAYSIFKTASNDTNIRCLNIKVKSSTGGTYIEFAYNKVELGNKPTDWTPALEDVDNQIKDAESKANQAKTDAANAQDAANNAQTSANTANNLLSDIASDNKLTPNEKQETKKEWDTIVSEYPKNTAQATKFGVSSVAYTAAYNALSSYIAPLLSNLAVTSDINGAIFRANFKAYYDARTDLLNSISIKAKELADAAQTSANNAQKEAEKVRTEYRADFVVLDTKIASKVSQTDFNALGQRVSTTESSITQLSNQITSVVETVDNIQVGGRNLLSKAGDFKQNTGNIVSNGASISLDTSTTYEGMSSIKIIGNDGVFSKEWAELRPNTIYTYSIMAKASTIVQGSAGSPLHMWLSENKTNGHSEIILSHDSTITTSWRRSWITFKTPNDGKTYYFKPYIYRIGNATVWVTTFKLEEGNKATDWTPSISDVDNQIQEADTKASQAQGTATQAKTDAANAQNAASTAQTSANNAQNTADSKNRSYYQDTVPAAPSGGHKPGDLWYKTSLVDSSGNVNADTSKNIYQLQYRWDGSVWRQVNWSVSKSKIEQTDSSISMIVEKTGINSVGAGSSLYSLINQTASEIRLEVSSIQIGGRNLKPNSKTLTGLFQAPSTYATANAEWMRFAMADFTGEILQSVNVAVQPSTEYTQSVLFRTDATDVNFNFTWWNVESSHREVKATIEKMGANTYRAYSTFKTSSKDARIRCLDIRNIAKSGGTYIEFAYHKFELGNKPTDWTEAPEDVQGGIDKAQNTADSKTTIDEVSSSLILTDNKISLASKTIELKGTTIAKAIESESLVVKGGNFKVEQNGTLKIAQGKIILNADGSGQLANGNIVWDTNGNIKVVGLYKTADQGARIEIDPNNLNMAYIGNSERVYSIWKASSQIVAMEFFTYSGTGSTIASRSTLGQKGLDLLASDFVMQGGKMYLLGTPTNRNDAQINQVYLDGETLKVRKS